MRGCLPAPNPSVCSPNYPLKLSIMIIVFEEEEEQEEEEQEEEEDRDDKKVMKKVGSPEYLLAAVTDQEKFGFCKIMMMGMRIMNLLDDDHDDRDDDPDDDDGPITNLKGVE